MLYLSNNLKEKKRNINIDLAVLPSYDNYTKRVMLARLLANKGPAIYVVHLNRYFCYTSMTLFSSHFHVTNFWRPTYRSSTDLGVWYHKWSLTDL